MFIRICAAIVMMVHLCGCAQQPSYLPRFGLEWPATEKRLLLIPDIRLSRITTDGTAEALPVRSKAATDAITAQIKTRLNTARVTPVDMAGLDNDQIQLVRLYGALVSGPLAPGTRADLRKHALLNDSLGPGTATLATRYGADYGLLLYLRDSTTSDGRVVANLAADVVLTLLSFGRVQQNISEAHRMASLALLDLHSGKVLWSTATTDDHGDLADGDDAARFTARLLQDIPL